MVGTVPYTYRTPCVRACTVPVPYYRTVLRYRTSYVPGTYHKYTYGTGTTEIILPFLFPPKPLIADQHAKANMSVSRTLYRELLRLGRRLDDSPLSKALLIAQPGMLFDRRTHELVRLPQLSGPQGQWARVLADFNGGEFYAPSRSVCAAIKSTRLEPAFGDPVDVGLAAIRTLGLAVAGGEALQKCAVDRSHELNIQSSLRLSNEIQARCSSIVQPS